MMPTNDKRAEYLANIELIKEGAQKLLPALPAVPGLCPPKELWIEALRVAHDVWDGVIMAPEIEAEEEAEDGEDWKNN